MKCILLPADGQAAVTWAEDFRAMARILGCELIERVTFEGERSSPTGDRHVLVVDESGLFAENPRFNLRASRLYGYGIRHQQPIMGDALVVNEGWVEDGPDFIDMPDAEAHVAYYNSIH